MVLPLSEFPAEMRAGIEALAAAPEPPPRYVSLGHARIDSRAFYEWHLRRGRDIVLHPLREKISEGLRQCVIERDGLTCRLCGLDVEPEDVHLDHITPNSKGGPTTLGNLQVTHGICNMRKGNRA